MSQVTWAKNAKPTKKYHKTVKNGNIHNVDLKGRCSHGVRTSPQEPVKSAQVRSVSAETGAIQCTVRSGTADPNSPAAAAAAALHADVFSYSNRPTVVCSTHSSLLISSEEFLLVSTVKNIPTRLKEKRKRRRGEEEKRRRRRAISQLWGTRKRLK